MDPSAFRSSTSRTSNCSLGINTSVQQRSSGSRHTTGQARTRPAQKRTRKRDSSGNWISSPVDNDTQSVNLIEGEEENDLKYDSDSKIYMACIMNGQRLGIAYYDVTTREMFVMDAWEDGEEEFPCLQLIKYQAQPQVIFTSTKMDEGFVAALQHKVVVQNGNAPTVKLVKSALFSLQQGRHRLAYLQVQGMDNDLSSEERIHVLNSMINLGNETIVRAAGGLLAILQQEMLIDSVGTSQNESHVDGNSIQTTQIESISELSLNGFLYMDATTHDALQIFRTEEHASAMGLGKSKEGFSVFGMLNTCVTAMGRRLLRLWFLRPILDLNVLNDRLDSIQLLRSTVDTTDALLGCLKNFKDVPRILKKILSPSSASISSDWLMLVESLGALWQIRGVLEVVTSQRHHYHGAFVQLQMVRKVFTSISEDLIQVSDLINGSIDFHQVCGESIDTMVAYGLCEELDELKRLYAGLPDFLFQVTASEQKRLPPELRSSKVSSTVYIPQVGYFMRFEGMLLDEDTLGALPDFEFAFQGISEDDNQTLESFYRTSKTHELDENIGDIYHKILDMERAVLRNLETRVEQHSTSLIEASKFAAEVDCLVALAIAAREHDYARPELTEDNLIIIKNGRHILQEVTVDSFVPNDTEICSEGRICIVTGPNYSGKSIYAKQVALIVFLAHIGSFVPADQAIVGLTDRIFTRIVSKETISVAQSTFMIDLNQIAAMLRHSTSRSLCIIDEFGKGTLAEDGIGLLCATLNEFATREAPPKVFAITHFSEVTDEDLLPKVIFRTMSIIDTKRNEANPLDEVVFLYRLVPGHAAPSYGIHCAELAGVPPEIIERSKEVLELVRAGEQIQYHATRRRVAKDKMVDDLVAKLLLFDCEDGDVEAFFRDIQATIEGNPEDSNGTEGSQEGCPEDQAERMGEAETKGKTTC